MVTENSFLIPKDTVADNTAASVDVQKFTWSKLQKVISKLGCETETQESLIFKDINECMKAAYQKESTTSI